MTPRGEGDGVGGAEQEEGGRDGGRKEEREGEEGRREGGRRRGRKKREGGRGREGTVLKVYISHLTLSHDSFKGCYEHCLTQVHKDPLSDLRTAELFTTPYKSLPQRTKSMRQHIQRSCVSHASIERDHKKV